MALTALALLQQLGTAHGEPAVDGSGAVPSARIAATVDRLARQHKVCAVAYATLKNGAVTGVGSANGCNAGPRPDVASVFQAASLSKTVFAYGVLKLVAQGRLALDAPLIGYLPKGYLHRQNPFDDNGPARTDAVTAPELAAVSARMVLQHTSGLPNWSSKALAFDFAPGSGWLYSGEGFMLLQRAVEAITGMALDAFMQGEVFDRLGMHSSHFRWRSALDDRLVPGIVSVGGMQAVRFTQPIAAASLYTTAHDYALFLAALLDDAALLRATLSGAVSVEPKIKLAWGLGWAIEQGPDPQAPLIWQWGNNPGYRAFAMASTVTRDGFVVLTNSEHGLALAAPLAAAVLPGPHPIFEFRMLR